MWPFIFAIILVIVLKFLWSLLTRRSNFLSPDNENHKLPPGPRGLPVIGNLHMLGTHPHRTLHELAKKYGPIMFIRLGCVPAVIVSTSEAAEIFLKTHDAVFASRPSTEVIRSLPYGLNGLIFAPYGSYWRNARKLCTLELLSARKIGSMALMRREEVGLLVESLREAAAAREPVNLSEKVAGLIEDMTYRMLFGRSKDERFNLRGIVQEFGELIGTFNLADYVPFLGPLDLQGLTRRLKKASQAIDKFLDTVIAEHEQKASMDGRETSDNRDFVDIMLSLSTTSRNTHDEFSSYMIDRTNIKAIVLDMIAGAIDTSVHTIEWALSEIIRNPRVMNKLQDELKNIVGCDRMVEETDLSKLEYLNMVVKETFRLHPILPLMVPHESLEDTMVNGYYYIPKKSRVIVNSWALGRDANVWSNNVEEFFPERFIGKDDIDIRGCNNFQLIPFGSGRRGCPGINLGLINVRLVVAQLVHCFDWDLPHGMKSSDMDMSETFGLSMRRTKSLLAIPSYRLHIIK